SRHHGAVARAAGFGSAAESDRAGDAEGEEFISPWRGLEWMNRGRAGASACLRLAAAVALCAYGAPPPPTYNRDIAPILNKRCVNCHREGEVGPFSLVSYTDAAKRPALIAQVTASHYMPPWKPAP